MLKTLMGQKLSGIMVSMASGLRGKKGMSKGKLFLIFLLFLYVAACFIFLFYMVFDSMALPFYSSGLGWLYFAMLALISFALMFVFSVFSAKSQLYEAKDNELLLSMPIPPGNILLSRMFALYIINLVSGLMVAIPALAAWLVNCPAAPVGIVGFILLCLLMPAFSLALSSLFAWILSLISVRIRAKNIFSVLFSLVFLGTYFYVFSQMNLLLARLASMGGELADALSPVKPLYWICVGIAEGSPLELALACLVMTVPFIIAYSILSMTFLRTATANRGSAKIKYTEKALRTSSPFSALYRRELGRFTSSAGYMLNAGLGIIFLLALPVIMAVKWDSLSGMFAAMPELKNLLVCLAPVTICLMCSTVTITASSLSLEGKSLWIAKSLPLNARSVLSAKLLLQISLSLPAVVLAQIVTIILLRPGGLTLLYSILLPPAFAVLIACIGLWENLRHCKLDWTNETQAVKNGISALITMLLAMVLSGAPIICSLFFESADSVELFLAIYTLIILGMAFLLYKLLMSRGERLFIKL